LLPAILPFVCSEPDDSVRVPVGGLDASRIGGAEVKVITHHFAGAHGRLVSLGWSIGRVVRRAQTLGRIQDALDDEEALLERADRLSARRALGNLRSTGMKGLLRYFIIDTAFPQSSSELESLNLVEKDKIRTSEITICLLRQWTMCTERTEFLISWIYQRNIYVSYIFKISCYIT